MTAYTSFWQAAPFVGGGALILGAQARIVKGLLDLLRRSDPEGSPETVNPTQEPVVEIPVTVTSAEADALRRRGVRVQQIKRAELKDRFSSVSMGDAFLLGGLGTAALMGGWSLADTIIDAYRKRRAEEQREQVRKRIDRLLNDTPVREDLRLHAQMKAAEAVYFGPQRKTAGPIEDALNALMAVLGGGAVIAGVRAYNKAFAENPESAKVKALKNVLKKHKVKTPFVTTVPVEVVSAASPAPQSDPNAVV